MQFYFWVILIVLIGMFCASIARLVFKKKTMLNLFVLLQTQKFIKIIDDLSKKYSKQLTFLSNFGIVAGFGPFGVDYLIKEKASKLKRIVVFLLTFVTFSFLTYFFTKNLFLTNPLIPIFIFYVIVFLTGLMGLSGFTLGALIFSAYDIIAKLLVGKVACPGIGLVIPGVKMPKMNFVIPWYGWLILIVAAMIHEFSHGIMLRVAKVKLKSVGVILFGILPIGAFVEPDEKQMEKKSKKEITKMYAAGPASNLLLCIIFGILLLSIASPISNYTRSIDNQREIGLFVVDVNPTTDICGSIFENPAYGKLEKNDLIVSINGNIIKTRTDLEKSIKNDYDNVFVVMNQDTNITRTEYIRTNELGNIGISANIKIDKNIPLTFKYSFLSLFLNVLTWFILLNFLIATTNFLPTIPFDGGSIAQNIFADYLGKKHSEKKRMKIVKMFFGYLILLLLILNIIPYFL